jgi:hypothetical protein
MRTSFRAMVLREWLLRWAALLEATATMMELETR